MILEVLVGFLIRSGSDFYEEIFFNVDMLIMGLFWYIGYVFYDEIYCFEEVDVGDFDIGDLSWLINIGFYGVFLVIML